MGIEYYLKRNDNRTVFNLGKGSDNWGEFLGDGNPTWLCHKDEDRLSAAIVADFGNGGWRWSGENAEREARRIAKMIVEWAEGEPFEFASEDGFDSWWDDPSWDTYLSTTGTRYLIGGLPDLGERCALLRDDGVAYDLLRGTRAWEDILGSGSPISIILDGVADLTEAILGKLSSESRRGVFCFSDGRELPGGCEGYAQHVARSIVEWADGRAFRFSVDYVGYPNFTGTRELP